MTGTASLNPDHAIWEEGFVRFSEAFRNADSRTVAVLTVHFAVEQELDVCLIYFLARPDKLGALKFGHKVRVLRAVCPDPYFDYFASSCVALDYLRNSLAHNNRSQIEGCMRRFLTSTETDNFKPKATAAGVEAAGKSLISGLILIRVENFAYAELLKPQIEQPAQADSAK